MSIEKMHEEPANNVIPILQPLKQKSEHVVSDEVFDSLEKIIEGNPMSANKALLDLMARKPGWEE